MTRGTTPTIRYTFKLIDVSDIVVAELRIQQVSVIIDKTLQDAAVGEDYLEWKLSQAETLSLVSGVSVQIQLRYKTSDGNAYATKITNESPQRLLKDGEI